MHGPDAGRWEWRTAGLAASLLALALLWAASRIERSIPFAPLALAELVIRLTPGDVATFFIERLQRNAVRIVAAAGTLVFVVFGVVAPEQSARGTLPRPWFAGLLFGMLAFAAALGANARPSLIAAAAPAAVAGMLYALALAWLAEAATAALSAETDASRRRALGVVASAAAGIAIGGTLLGRLVRGAGPESVALTDDVRRARIPDRAAFPGIDGLSAEVTAPGDHYVVDINIQKPAVDVDSWRLEVTGLVDRPLELGFDELQRRFRVIEQHSVLTCVSNEVGGPLIGNSAWTGVRLRDVLTAAGLKGDAADLVFHCADGYTVSIPPARALDPAAILAIGQSGEPLTVEHGFPCRLRVPALYGMMNAKWIERIEAVDHDFEGYWAERGWSDVAIVRTQSRIDTVSPDPRVGRSSWVAGVAWAGDRGIARLDVSVDGGRSWRAAQLREPVGPLAWMQWAHRWTPDRSGVQRVICRATDGDGMVQDSKRRRPHPAGATGYHEIDVEVA